MLLNINQQNIDFTPKQVKSISKTKVKNKSNEENKEQLKAIYNNKDNLLEIINKVDTDNFLNNDMRKLYDYAIILYQKYDFQSLTLDRVKQAISNDMEVEEHIKELLKINADVLLMIDYGLDIKGEFEIYSKNLSLYKYYTFIEDTGGIDGLFHRMNNLADNTDDIRNYSLSASVGSSALTITLNGANGSALSSTNPFTCVFRNATAATGTPTEVETTSSPTLTISSGSTLGHASAIAHYIYVYAIYNGSAVVLGASSTLFDDGTLVSSTAEGGAGGADSGAVMYTTSAVTSKASRLIGRMVSTQATAGTWATAISEISLV